MIDYINQNLYNQSFYDYLDQKLNQPGVDFKKALEKYQINHHNDLVKLISEGAEKAASSK